MLTKIVTGSLTGVSKTVTSPNVLPQQRSFELGMSPVTRKTRAASDEPLNSYVDGAIILKIKGQSYRAHRAEQASTGTRSKK
jgi:hypothetical protein